MGLLKTGVLQVLSSWENLTEESVFEAPQEKTFYIEYDFLRTKNGILWQSN